MATLTVPSFPSATIPAQRHSTAAVAKMTPWREILAVEPDIAVPVSYTHLAFVEIFPGTDGLLHVSEIAEHRVKEVKDELREGDQVLVKVLAIEGNRIKLSRKAVLREQREKLKGKE